MEHNPSFPVTPALVDRYLAGQASAEERLATDRWFDADPARRRALHLFQQELAGRRPPVDPALEWSRFLARRTSLAPASPKLGSLQPRFRSWRWVAIPGAIVAGVIALAMTNVVRIEMSWLKGKATATALEEYATAKGERAIVRLADGTQIVLNVASRLRVPADFGNTTRTVYLEGEAQFTVTHDDAKPFAVHAGGTVVRDLATVFGVRAYPSSMGVQVAVASGKVAVHAESAPRPNGATVSPGEVAFVAVDGETRVTPHARIGDLLSWTTGRLVIENMPVRDALTQLSRWYDVDFEVPDSARLAGRVSVTVTDRPLSDADLDDLSHVFGATAVRHGNTITLTPLPRSH